MIYGGRWPIEPPSDREVLVLDEWDTLPRDIDHALGAAAQLIVLDPLSFPFEALPARLWDVPMAVRLPADVDSRELDALLGTPALSRLGPQDIVIDAGHHFEQLARTYHLPQANHFDVVDNEIPAAVSYLVDLTALHQEALVQLRARSVRRRDTWVLRTREAKADFNVESGAVTEELARLAGALPKGTVGHAVVLGCGSGEWLMVVRRAGFTASGFDLSHAAVQRAHFNYPQVQVRHPGLQATGFDLRETADVALIAGVLGSLNHDARLRMLAWMWSALRPGGSLLVLDDYVGDRGTADWVPIADLTAEIIEATTNHALLENARALRLPAEGFHRVGLIAYTKLGGAERL